MFFGPIIRTRYLGPTYAKGSRVIADHRRDSQTVWRVILSWDHAVNADANHEKAARALLGRFSQPMELVGRGHDADCYQWLTVCADTLRSTAAAIANPDA